MPRPKVGGGLERRRNPVTWCAVVVCAIVAIAAVIAGVVVFIGYMVIRPKLPSLSVQAAHLDNLYFDEVSSLSIQMRIVVKAENGNGKAHASFSHVGFMLGFHGTKIARLVNDAFDVRKNSSVEFQYVVKPWSVPLSTEAAEIAGLSVKEDLVWFELRGGAKTSWRVWIIGTVTMWVHLNCDLSFFPLNGTSIGLRCSSSHSLSH